MQNQRLVFSFDAGLGATTLSTIVPIRLNQPHHAVITFNVSVGITYSEIRVDGLRLAQGQEEGGMPLILNSRSLFVGLIPSQVTNVPSAVDNTGYFGCLEQIIIFTSSTRYNILEASLFNILPCYVDPA